MEVQLAIKETDSNRETINTVQDEEPSRPQPDVVSGLENFSDNVSQHLEHFADDAEQHETTTTTTSTTEKDNSSDETSKSSEFESIYDKFRDKSDEEVEEPPIGMKIYDNFQCFLRDDVILTFSCSLQIQYHSNLQRYQMMSLTIC